MSDPTTDQRRLVLVAGAGRSGTSLMTGILSMLGMSVPQPEISADETNPRGFSEPRWVVDFHVRLMRMRRLTSLDGRPTAVEMAAAAAADAEVTETLRSWLEVQFVGVDQVVVKDPRLVWFLPLWQQCAQQLGISTGVVTMLRYPTEVIASARTWYGDWQSDPSRACGWINVMLETERISRQVPRAYVAYADLLTDWRAAVARVGTALDIPTLVSVDPASASAIDGFVDPGLRRQTVGWEGMGVPDRVRQLAEEVWEGLIDLSRDDATASPTEQMDAWRADYVGIYTEAEQLAQSTIHAASKGVADAGRGATSATTRPKQPAPAGRRRRGPRRAVRGLVDSTSRRARSNPTTRKIATRLRNQPTARAAYRRLQRLLGP